MKLSGVLLFLMLCSPIAAEAGINLVQHVNKDAGTTVSTSLPFGSSNTAGNFIAIAVRSGQSGESFTISDSRGNTYRQAVLLNVTLDTPPGDTLAIYYAENIGGGANTVTISQSLSASMRIAVLEYAGVAAASSLDQTAAAQASGTAANSGSVTTSAADLLLGAAISANERTFTAGTNFTIQDRVPASPNSKLITEDWIQTSAGTGTATASLSSSGVWGAVVAAFRPSTTTPITLQPDLKLSKTHTGSFAQGQTGASFTLTVSNVGTGPTSGTITMTDTLPAGLTATALTGTGWSCSLASVSCTRSDVLQAGASYPAITLTVNVSGTAPSTVTNTASVSSGGDSNVANNSASDVATIGSTSDTQAPTPPGSLNASAASGNQINLAWNASTDNTGVAAYRVERCQGAGCSSFSEIGTQGAGPITGPLSVSSNPNYFQDATGTPIILNGSQTWNSLQDWGTNGSTQPLDFTAFVDFLTAHGHNFTLLWRTELPKFCGLPTSAASNSDFTVGPHPWPRTGPGTATDGGPKFDLSQFDQNYFDRLRARVQALKAANIYAGVYLFTGEWLAAFRCAGDGYPFSGANNVNGIDDGGGVGSMTMTSSNALTSFQDAYVRKVIDTLNDMPNVLWIVSEEAPANTDWWHVHQISLIHTYESDKPYRHPVGYAVRSDYNEATLINSDSDWIAPVARISPTTSCGSGTPACKVNINDSDHSYFGMWNDTAQANRTYAWENFTNGNQLLFMDPYSVYYPRENRNLCPAPFNGICSGPDTRWDNFRNNLGAILSYSRRLNLANVTPRAALCSTSNCLAQTPSAGAEYLIYSPSGGSFTVNLSAMPNSRTLAVEWFNPSTGAVIPAASVPAGSSSQSFTPPFSGDAVLYLADSSGHAAPQSLTTSTSFSDTSLQSGQNYSYRVRAADTAGNMSSYSNVASAATSSTDVISPTSPSGVVATPFSSSQIILTWAASTDNIAVTGYLLERCQGAGCSTFAALPSSVTTPGYSDSGLTAATSYSYRLRALDAVGNLSPYSAIASAITTGSSSPAAITLVQHQAKDAGTTVSTSLAFGSSNTAGNFIAIAVRSGRSGESFTISDSRGNTYRQAVLLNVTLDTPSGDTLAIYYAESIGGGANTVTITQSLSSSLRFAISEYQGVASGNSLDRTASAQASGAAVNSGSVTTSAADLLLGAVMSGNGRTFTAGTNFTIQDSISASPNSKLITEDWIQASAGTGTATASLSSSDVWGAVVAAFRPSTTAPITSQPDLKLTKTHTGSFAQGQTGASYTLTVSNIGTGPTSGTITMTDALPAGLAATALTGTGWSCTLASISCTRSDVLQQGASYPPMTLTVNVSGTAPSSVTNTASVSGGGDSSVANNSASDVTTIGSGADTQAPTAPGTLSGSAPDGSRVDLTWLPATDNVAVADYRVERCDGTCTISGGGFVKRVTLTTTSFSDSGLMPSTTYSYVVRAEDAVSNLGPYSNVVTLTTPATVPELVVAFSFDETSGTAVSDSSGKGNTGAIVNATRSSGKYGNALLFNGTNAKVSVPDATTLHLTTAMTLEAWVNPSAVSSAWRDIIEKGNDNYFLMGTSSFSGAPGAGGFLGGVNTTAAGASPLPTNTWSHLAATYDGVTLRLYVNAVEVSTAARAGTMTSSTSPLEIGGDSLFGQYFLGLIDEVRIYNTARTPSQILSDMNSPIGNSYPLVSLSTNNLSFGSVSTGSTSTPQSVTMTNIGGAALAISGVSITGANNTEFSQSNNCGSTLASNASCAITATFTPGNTGARNASLRIDDNAAGSPHLMTLTGTGLGYAITPRISVLTPTVSQQFTVTGASGGGIQWAVDGVSGGSTIVGTISASGLYSPPLAMGAHTVTATDQSLVSSATVYVTTYPGTLTHHNDNARTGQNLSETVLTPANVTPATFGKLLSYDLDGLSIASPLYVAGVAIPSKGTRNVVYVATEHDSVYAFDADGGNTAPLWKVSFLVGGATTVPAADTGECCDIAPEIGITGTPVIDAATKTLFVVAKTKEGSGYFQRLHALDIATGAEKPGGWPITIQATAPGSGQGSSGGQISFNALRQNQRPALTLSNGVVYVGFGAHGDIQPYHGWVLGYNVSTLQQTMAVNLSPNADGGGIWQANGGPAVDTAGNIYVITGNGAFTASSGNGKDYGDSFMKISPSGAIVDYFTPYDQSNINSADFDLGAAGPLLLPDQPGAHPHLMVSAGKNNTIYLVDRDSMGHINSSNNDSQIVQSLINIFPHGTPEPGNYSAAVYFNGRVYFGPIADNIQAFQLTNGKLSSSAVTRSQEMYKYPGATMAISANGSSNGLLWAIQRNGDCGVVLTCSSATPGVLRAYDAGSSGNTLIQVYSSDQMGSRDALDFATKFSVPLVANGKVFVSSMTRLTIYGLLP